MRNVVLNTTIKSKCVVGSRAWIELTTQINSFFESYPESELE